MKILVFGGTGFIGSKLVEQLKMKKHEVYTFSRRNNADFNGSITDPYQVAKACEGMDMVINTVGLSPILKTNKYHDIHVIGVDNIIRACNKNGIDKLIHISAFGVDQSIKGEYFSTKAEAEELIKSSGLNYSIYRPTVVYDEGAEFFTLIQKFSPPFVLFLPHFTNKVQPVSVDVLAQTIADEVDNVSDKTKSIAGDKVISLYDFYRNYFQDKYKLIVPIPILLVKMGLRVNQLIGGFIFNKDLIEYTTSDIVVEN